MSSNPKTPTRRWPLYLGAVVLAFIVIGGLSFVVVSALEERDSFCTSCHTTPETTYFNRAYIALDNPADPIPDLATAHYVQASTESDTDAGTPFKCITCHRGDASLSHRVSTLALAARDTVIWASGQANPALAKSHLRESWLPNAACLTCHTDLLLTLNGIDNHFHTNLPQAAQAFRNGGKLTISPKFTGDTETLLKHGLDTVNVDLLCTSCHQPHKELPNAEANFFMDTTIRNQACVQCHQVAKRGPQSLRELNDDSQEDSQ